MSLGLSISCRANNYLRPVVARNASFNSTSSKLPNNILKKPSQPLSESGSLKVERISQAMKLYLEAAKKRASLLKERKQEFELGKRHLANIMGYNHDSMTQQEINEAIEYLFPTGLFSPKQRPVMLPPEMIYPKLKEADFDVEGRPFHSFAFTRMPIFYEIMYNIADCYKKCNDLEDKMISRGVLKPPPEAKADLAGSRWFNVNELKKECIEKINDKAFASFLYSINKLADHPYSDLCKEFLMKYRIPLTPEVTESATSTPTYTEDGRCYVTVETRNRTAKAIVKIWLDGTGKFTVNGQNILYFPILKDRKQILFPLVTSKMLGKVDVEAEAWGGGIAGQTVAIRCGIAFGLKNFVDDATQEEMRVAGLLQLDTRFKERNKPGKRGPRRSGAWRPR